MDCKLLKYEYLALYKLGITYLRIRKYKEAFEYLNYSANCGNGDGKKIENILIFIFLIIFIISCFQIR